MALTNPDFPHDGHSACAFIVPDSESVTPGRQRLARLNREFAAAQAARVEAQTEYDRHAPLGSQLQDLVAQHQDALRAMLDGPELGDYADKLYRVNRLSQQITELEPRVDHAALRAALKALEAANARLAALSGEQRNLLYSAALEAAEAYLERHVCRLPRG